MADLEHWRVYDWLKHCSEHGYDLLAPREMTNFFFSPTQDRAHELAGALVECGHRIVERGEFRDSEDGDFWVVKSEIVMKMSVDSMENLIDLCESVAKLHESTYDGWETD